MSIQNAQPLIWEARTLISSRSPSSSSIAASSRAIAA
jgi:hypothetical protein